jgi:TPP-dependent indolepyruvate ferredoxin oxidoreductase alpha subunit
METHNAHLLIEVQAHVQIDDMIAVDQSAIKSHVSEKVAIMVVEEPRPLHHKSVHSILRHQARSMTYTPANSSHNDTCC